MNKLYWCGDTHLNIDIQKLSIKSFPEQKTLTKDDYVIVCGDYGLLFNPTETGLTVPSNPNDKCWSKEELYWLDYYTNVKNFTTLWVDGNHCNFDRIETYPITEWNGGKVQFINDSIIHLMRGQVYTIGDKTIFTMGGAASHDRGPATHTEERDIHKIWWPQENITERDMVEAWKNLDRVGNKVDYIVTHEVPQDVHMRMGFYNNDPNCIKLQQIKETVSYDTWFAGHYHRFDRYSNVQVLYNQVVRFNKKGELINVCQGLYRE